MAIINYGKFHKILKCFGALRHYINPYDPKFSQRYQNDLPKGTKSNLPKGTNQTYPKIPNQTYPKVPNQTYPKIFADNGKFTFLRSCDFESHVA